jgi:hypothetical protein
MNIVPLSSFQREKNRMNMIKFVDLTDSSNSVHNSMLRLVSESFISIEIIADIISCNK